MWECFGHKFFTNTDWSCYQNDMWPVFFEMFYVVFRFWLTFRLLLLAHEVKCKGIFGEKIAENNNSFSIGNFFDFRLLQITWSSLSKQRGKDDNCVVVLKFAFLWIKIAPLNACDVYQNRKICVGNSFSCLIKILAMKNNILWRTLYGLIIIHKSWRVFCIKAFCALLCEK